MPLLMRLVLSTGVLLLPLTVGCGKKPDSGVGAGGAGVVPADPSDRKAVEANLERLLPAGGWGVETWSAADGSAAGFGVCYNRPGFENNWLIFKVLKQGLKVTVEAKDNHSLGEFVYEGGRLKSELVRKATPPQWEFLQKRSEEVAKAALAAMR